MESKRVEYKDRIEWQNEKGSLHREDGPAVEWVGGSKEWYINGKRHRLDGPAIEWNNDNRKYWYINGKHHREDGPAVEFTNGYKSWYLNGKNYSEEQWKEEIVKLKLNRIKDL